jgi:hypothetical protein
LLLILGVGFITGLACLASPWFHAVAAFSEEEHIGIHIAAGEGFLSPFSSGPTAPPTSWCPPVYPMFVGAVYRTLGVRAPAAVSAIIIFNMLCRAASGVALFWLGRRIFRPSIGVLAAGLFLLNPIFLNAAVICWDNSLALAIFLWLLVAAISGGKPRTLGVGAGLLLLTNVAYVLAMPFIFMLGLHGKKKWIAASLWLCLTLLPWTARNYFQFHRLIFIRGNAYTELWLGNQPDSSGWMTSATLSTHPSNDPANRNQLFNIGENAYSDLCRQRFWNELASSPPEFFLRCRNRVAYLFIGEPSHAGTIFNCVLAILGLAGAYAAWRLNPLTISALLASAPYIATQVCDRYAMPLRAVLSLGAAVAIYELIARLNIARSKTSSPGRRPERRMSSRWPMTPSGRFDSNWPSARDSEMSATSAGRR